MRIIGGTELHNDLTSCLPVASANIVTAKNATQRATFIPYFERFIRVLWKEEPAEKHLKRLCEKLTLHLAATIAESDLLQHAGDLVESGNITEPEQEQPLRFPCGISDAIASHLNEAVVQGVEHKHYQLGAGHIVDHVDGPAPAFSRVENELRKETALNC